jgi:hypothetical protein
MHAAIETVTWPVHLNQDFVVANTEKSRVNKQDETKNRSSSTITLWFTRDYLLFFKLRADIEAGSTCLLNRFLKHGLQVNVGTNSTPSRTEAI